MEAMAIICILEFFNLSLLSVFQVYSLKVDYLIIAEELQLVDLKAVALK